MGPESTLTEPGRGNETVEGEVILVEEVDNASSEDNEVDESAVQDGFRSLIEVTNLQPLIDMTK